MNFYIDGTTKVFSPTKPPEFLAAGYRLSDTITDLCVLIGESSPGTAKSVQEVV